MDGAQEFVNKLNFIERELTALKTAHNHPIGAISFNRKDQTLNITLNDLGYGFWQSEFAIVVKVSSSDNTPIVQVGFDSSGATFTNLNSGVRANNTEFWYNFNAYSMAGANCSMSFTVISSVDIDSIIKTGVITL